jgi:hypothetical protein
VWPVRVGGTWGRVGVGEPVPGKLPSYILSSLPQDPDLEAKRKAELAKIKQQNRRFKEKVGQTLRRQKAGSTVRRSRPPRSRPQEPAQAEAQD